MDPEAAPASADAAASQSDPDDQTSAPTGPSVKGRPTPKRSEAEKARKERVKPALTRREQLQRDRQRSREERAKTRRAMDTGDERYFLARDQGPVRKFVRDFVDSRRTIAEFFLPIILLILLLTLVPSRPIQLASTVVWVLSMILLIADLSVLGVRIKRKVRERFPDDTKRGHVFYGVVRATQLRRLRLPKPTVKPGALV